MKKILATLLLGTALAVAALPVSAAGVDNAVTLTANGNTAAVHLSLPENEAQGVTAMQLSFEVESSDSINVEFVFDSAVSASVKEYTYNEQTGILNVYLAGRSELLSSDGSADLGEIQLNGADGSDASVRFVPDSLRLVDASLGQTETTVTSNGEVKLTVTDTVVPTPSPETTPKPESTPKPETTPAPDATPAPTQTPSGGNTSGSGSDQSSSSGSQGSSNDSKEESAQSTATSNSVSSAVSGTSGQQSSGQSSSGSKKPSSVSTATPAPEATATPEKETQATPAPTATTQSPAETATPEQSLSEEDSGSKLPVVPIAIAVCVVVAAIIGVAVIRFRG